MPDRYADIARRAPDLAEALDPAERDALARALGQDDAEAEAVLAHWEAARRHLGVRLREDLPDPHLLVLYALADDPVALGTEEEARLEAARPQLEAAIAQHPALRDVVARVRADRDGFEDAWAEPAEPATARVPGRRPAADRPAARSPRRWAWRTAVGAALVVFAGLLVFIVQRDAGYETVRTAAGETRTLDLADGTTVHLAEKSTLEIGSFEEGERRVRLAGEAVFAVVPGEMFVVETPTALTTVLGTTFSVRADPRETEVVLASGVVALAPRAGPAEAVRLEPGQRARVLAGQPPSAPTSADVTEALEWTGLWYLQAEPLDEIADRLSAHYGVRIEVPAVLARERITGTFEQAAPAEQTLQTLATALGVRVEGDAASGFRFTPSES